MTTNPRRCVDEASFVTEDTLQRWCDRIGEAGLRSTAGAAHERTIAWVEEELSRLPGLSIRTDPFEVLRWQPRPDGDLERAGTLQIVGSDGGSEPIAVAGAVPYTLPGVHRGPVVHVPPDEQITRENAHGKVVLRDFPHLPLPYDYLLDHALHATPGAEALRGEIWDRPGLADTLLHLDLLAAGDAGAAGVVIGFDLPREQVAGYFEPHKGTHYQVPAVFVGIDEREQLHRLAAPGGTTADTTVEVAVQADVGTAPTRNVYATLPGRSSERIILVTHTDGNTWVQENGIAALLALATYFSSLPIEQRPRTLEFAFTSAHLHISREGSAHYAAELDREFDDGDVVFVFPIEHLGARRPGARGPTRRTGTPARLHRSQRGAAVGGRAERRAPVGGDRGGAPPRARAGAGRSRARCHGRGAGAPHRLVRGARLVLPHPPAPDHLDHHGPLVAVGSGLRSRGHRHRRAPSPGARRRRRGRGAGRRPAGRDRRRLPRRSSSPSRRRADRARGRAARDGAG